MEKYWIFIVLILATWISFIFATEYGSIAGRVFDEETNEPLENARVWVEHTKCAAKTNEHGYYYIHSIRTGTYRISLTAPGYAMITHVGVRIESGKSTALDFYTHGIILATPMLTFDQPHTKSLRTATFNYKDIVGSSATDPIELIRLLPGIITSEYGSHLRGGTSDDITYYVDGLIMMWPHMMGWQHISIPLSAIEEISLQSGSIEARYGETRAGIVNIVTRQAGARHAARIHYSTDEIFSGDKLNFGYNRYDVIASGPLEANISYFFSGDYVFNDAFQEAKYRITSPRTDYHGYGKLTYQIPNARGQLSLSGFRAREQYVRWSPYIEPGNTFKYFDQRPMTRTKYWYGMAALDYRFSSKNLTSLRIDVDHFDRCYGNRDYTWEEENGHSWYNDYRFKAEHLIPYLLDEEWQGQNYLTIRDILVDSMMTYHNEAQNRGAAALRNNPWGIEGRLYTYGDYWVWSYSQNNNIQACLEINQYFNRYFKLKSGIHFIKYDIRYYNNPTAWYDFPLWDYYLCEPYRIDGYLEHNLYHRNVSATVGVRLDYFHPNTESRIDTTPFIVDTLENPSFTISPRLNINIPIMNRLKINFDYGHYVRVYYRYKTTFRRPFTYRTTVYGLSADYNFLHDLAVGLDLYYKKHNDWLQDKSNEYDYNIYGTCEYDDYVGVMGMQLDLYAKLSSYTSLVVAYNLQYAYGSNFYWYYGYYYPSDTTETVAPADFDERHQIRVQLQYQLPSGFSFGLLRDSKAALTFFYGSGQPFTPMDWAGNYLGDKNSERMPGYWNVDLKFTRCFGVGPTRLVLTALVRNLFNTGQIFDVYNTTGDPDDPGYPLPSVGQFSYISILNETYSPQADFNHDGLMTAVERRDDYADAIQALYQDPTNYGSPLRVRLGIGIEL
ncbi:hypothetical protein AMJ83_05325 [candidate division WOR_3 bacterium SM23_42]|uniref:Uncharacterized protein n=1 Tax=candidate division WOR_3 bacterium SM23_42 TaxID=1703779 RepID=A0A0S8FW35_UNCW3|nr:MAG: hypothetical protein AMJ83_05325 [candidate division WOR_3 bacterium SM23_42]